MHHTPLYTIDYLEDIYYLEFELNDDDKKQISFFGNGITAENYNSKWLELLKGIAKNSFGEKREEKNKLLKMYLNFIRNKSMQKYTESNLYPFEHYCSVSEEDYACDDRCGLIAAELKNQIDVSEADMEVYKKSFAAFLNEVVKNNRVKGFFILGGHVHKANKGNIEKKGLYEKNEGIYEVPKFFAKDKICFSKLLIPKTACCYIFSPKIYRFGIDYWNKINQDDKRRMLSDKIIDKD